MRMGKSSSVSKRMRVLTGKNLDFIIFIRFINSIDVLFINPNSIQTITFKPFFPSATLETEIIPFTFNKSKQVAHSLADPLEISKYRH